MGEIQVGELEHVEEWRIVCLPDTNVRVHDVCVGKLKDGSGLWWARLAGDVREGPSGGGHDAWAAVQKMASRFGRLLQIVPPGCRTQREADDAAYKNGLSAYRTMICEKCGAKQ